MARPIGELLTEAGIINEEMIRYALQVQKVSKERLGEILLRLRFVTDTEIARVLSEQSGHPFTDLAGVLPEVEVLRQLPYNFAQRYDLLPVALENGELIVVTADPFDDQGLSRISRFARNPIRLQVAPRSKLREDIQHHYYFAEHPIEQEVERIATAAQSERNWSPERLVELLIDTAIDMGASDVHINPTGFATLVSYRIDGVLQLRYSLPAQIHHRLSSTIKIESSMDIAEMNRPQDGRRTYAFLQEEYDLRVSIIPTIRGENVVIRVLSGGGELISAESIGFRAEQVEAVQRIADRPFGMLLVTGPTGSGKSTTLYAMLRKINAMEKNVLTIEDPVEYNMPLIRQMAVNERAGITFSSAIRNFLRQDPDVMLVGEIRDGETAGLAVTAAQTGHLVLSTLHTNDASGAIPRLRDLGVEDFLISSSLAGIVAQRLVRRLCPYCKEEVALAAQEKERLKLNVDIVQQHVGCEHCQDTGYIGRTAVGEVLEVDDDIRRLIDAQATSLAIKAACVEKGMKTMWDSALQLVEQGVTDLYEIERVII